MLATEKTHILFHGSAIGNLIIGSEIGIFYWKAKCVSLRCIEIIKEDFIKRDVSK